MTDDVEDPCPDCGTSDWQSLGINGVTGQQRWKCMTCGRREWAPDLEDPERLTRPTRPD